MPEAYPDVRLAGSRDQSIASPAVHGTELNAWWRIGSLITAGLMHLLFRVRIEGIEHVPARGAGILAFNHISVLDGPCLGIATARARRRECRFLVAAEMFRRVFLGWVLRTFDQIPIRRGGGDEHALDEAIRTVGAGALAAIAPEGRVNDEGVEELQRIRSGVARIAIPTGAPVIPVGIWGTQVRWPRSGPKLRRPLRPVLAFSYGPPLQPPSQMGDQADFLSRIGEAIEDRVRHAHAMSVRRRG
jgi:1-acyl-sn-glycerol-3-phosphate acyltransferase